MSEGLIGDRRNITKPWLQFLSNPLSTCQMSFSERAHGQLLVASVHVISLRHLVPRASPGNALFSRFITDDEPALWCTKTKLTCRSLVALPSADAAEYDDAPTMAQGLIGLELLARARSKSDSAKRLYAWSAGARE